MDETKVLNKDDPLSAALGTMKLRAFISVALDAGGQWGVDFSSYEGFTLNVVQRGECWLILGERGKLHLKAGDCFLLTGGKPFTLASDLSHAHRDRAELLFSLAKNGVAVSNGGGQFFAVGIVFKFEGHLPALLFHRLPPVIHIDGDSDHAAAFRWSLERFNAETRHASLGSSMMLNHLAPIMLLQMLRIHLALAPAEESWLQALAHPRLSKVLQALQTDYKRGWSLEHLASLAGMSRSGFALNFKKIVGVSPLVYLLNWRMQIACELLRMTQATLAEIAAEVGYDSESAFSTAFSRVLKCRPGEYRRRLTPFSLQ